MFRLDQIGHGRFARLSAIVLKGSVTGPGRGSCTNVAKMITIESIQIGKVVTEGDPESKEVANSRWTSAFRKTPVESEVTVKPSGIVGDEVADTIHHGGVDKAILCYAMSHYPEWQREHPALKFAAGGFGENLTLSGVDESGVCVGDRLRCGDCEFEVSQPRQPCWKISRRWRTKTMTKEVAATGRTGWYLRVLQGGVLSNGMVVEVIDRPHHDWTIERCNDVLFRRRTDADLRDALLEVPQLAQDWKQSLR